MFFPLLLPSRYPPRSKRPRTTRKAPAYAKPARVFDPQYLVSPAFLPAIRCSFALHKSVAAIHPCPPFHASLQATPGRIPRARVAESHDYISFSPCKHRSRMLQIRGGPVTFPLQFPLTAPRNFNSPRTLRWGVAPARPSPEPRWGAAPAKPSLFSC